MQQPPYNNPLPNIFTINGTLYRLNLVTIIHNRLHPHSRLVNPHNTPAILIEQYNLDTSITPIAHYQDQYYNVIYAPHQLELNPAPYYGVDPQHPQIDGHLNYPKGDYSYLIDYLLTGPPLPQRSIRTDWPQAIQKYMETINP